MIRDRRAGVTLIEILIAVSLLSLLSVGVLLALRVGLSALDKSNRKLMDNRRVAGAQRVLQQQLAGFMPVMASCSAGPPDPGMPPSYQRLPFFQGEPQSMRFVSTYSLPAAARGLPQILEFQVVPREDGQGVRLIVNEHLYSGPLSAGFFCLGLGLDPVTGVQINRFRPIQASPNSFVLMDKLASCRFSYREALPPPRFERWSEYWAMPFWPSAIRMEITPVEEAGGKLQPMPVTVPIRITRPPGFVYDEF